MLRRGRRGASRLDRFRAHLDDVTGGIEPRVLRTASTDSALDDVLAITYSDLPEPGMLTALTYGISLASHPDWRYGKPELCLSVQSLDEDWPMAMAFIAEQLRGTCPFSYSDVLRPGGAISDDSAMNAFVIFAPAVFEGDAATGIDVGDDLPINISGCYPIHDSERQFISANGLEAFWKLDWDPYDVKRPPAA